MHNGIESRRATLTSSASRRRAATAIPVPGHEYFDAASCRCASRYSHDPKDRGFSLGFRIARDDR
jgi:formylglycine-generating enzyme required for sulfatase activity